MIGFMLAELMYGQKPIMPVEHTIFSWAAIDWTGEMSWEELLRQGFVSWNGGQRT